MYDNVLSGQGCGELVLERGKGRQAPKKRCGASLPPTRRDAMSSFRDATIVVLEVGRDVLQAVHGLHELLPRPSAVSLRLCCLLRPRGD
jgi:hypothetical protein